MQAKETRMRPALIRDDELAGLKLQDRVLVHDWERERLKEVQSITNKKEFAMEILRLRNQALSIVSSLRSQSYTQKGTFLIAEDELEGLSATDKARVRMHEKILLDFARRYMGSERQFAKFVMENRMHLLGFAEYLKRRM